MIPFVLVPAHSQQAGNIEGFYASADYSMGLRLRAMGGNELHGTYQTADGVFALKATVRSGTIKGTLYTDAQNYPFEGSASASGVTLTSSAGTYPFFKVSNDHGLAGTDLTPYFKEKKPTTGGIGTAGSGNGEVFNLVAGSQLVYYQRTSYVNDNTASSITYVNFCRDGRFNLNYDGGFSVEGGGGNAQGASYGSNFGTWKVSEQGGVPYVTLTFANGQQTSNAVNVNYLRQGRWRIGNTQYALVRNKVNCR